MRHYLIAVALLAGCSPEFGAGTDPANQTRGDSAPDAPAPVPATGSSLVGLYEGGPATARDQICMVERDGETRFGLVLWGANGHSCSGSGTARREGQGRVILEMAGDSPCTVEARFEGGSLDLAVDQQEGCAYYCGARARLNGAELVRTGAAEADAMRAKDLVGEPLCRGV